MTLTHKQGTSWYGLEIVISEVDADGTEIPADLTGCDVILEFRSGCGTTPSLILTSPDDATVEGDTIRFRARYPDEFELEDGVYHWTPKILWPPNEDGRRHVDVIESGTLEVKCG